MQSGQKWFHWASSLRPEGQGSWNVAKTSLQVTPNLLSPHLEYSNLSSVICKLRCGDCFEWGTNERRASPSITWLSSKVTNMHLDGKELCLEWKDGHISKFNLQSLITSIPRDEDHVGSLSMRLSSPVNPSFTSISDPLNEIGVSYQEFMESDSGVSNMLASVLATGFGIVSNVRGLEATKLAHDRICHPTRTMYGDGVTVLEPAEEHNDAAYSSVPLPLHTDTTYFTEPMGLAIKI